MRIEKMKGGASQVVAIENILNLGNQYLLS